jgi:uncharacterized surface protein with fasciclin (FAS1) repeats
MKSTEVTFFAQDQIYKGILDLQGPDQYAEMASGNHILYGSNVAQAGENMVYDRPSTVGEVIVNEQNGLLVKVDYPIESRIIMGQILTCNPADEGCTLADPDMSEFAELLVDLKLLDDRFKDPITKESQPRLKFLAGDDYWTAFIPTNAAMEQARAEGIIPYEFPKTADGKDSLENFVMYHFIRGKVVFDNGEASGEFKTNYVYKDTVENINVYALLQVNNQPQNLSLTDRTGQEVFLDHAKANILVRQGTMHKIDAVLKYTEE